MGSNLIEFLNKKGIMPYVYDTGAFEGEKWKNVIGLKYLLIDSPPLFSTYDFDVIVHLGANTDTRDKMSPELWENNVDFTQKMLAQLRCSKKLIYASSGATYGAESQNFQERIDGLKPLNAYAFTKLYLDNYFFGINDTKNVFGLRFFNAFGPRENHKDDMASMAHRALFKDPSIYQSASNFPERLPAWKLYKSYREGIEDGGAKRDFIYVEDVCEVIWHFIENDCPHGIYNVGSGVASSFNDLVKIVDPTMPIDYVEMPPALQKQYQYYTRANLEKLRNIAGYKGRMTALEEGVRLTREKMKL